MKARLLLLLSAVCLLTSCWRNFHAQMQKEAADFTEQHCPWQVEPGTRLDSLTYSAADTTLTRHFTLSIPNEMQVRMQEARFRQLLLEQVRGDVTMKGAKEGGCNFRFLYRNIQGDTVLDARIRHSDYQTARQ